MTHSPETRQDLCILISIYGGFKPLAAVMQKALEEFWPGKPPVFVCGASEQLEDLGTPLRRGPGVSDADWVVFVGDAAKELEQRGFRYVYLLCEEHIPLAPCHTEHLNQTLPALSDELDARYIGLMGWDNRRYVSKAPVLGRDKYRLKHLVLPRDPRFHLHPSLWRVETLVRCCELVRQRPDRSPWRFEKTADKPDAPLPEADRQGCYQVCADSMNALGEAPLARAGRRLSDFLYNRLMSLYPFLQSRGLGRKFWSIAGFDDFFYPGPYPMFFSGIMSKGTANAYFMKWLARRPGLASLSGSIHTALAQMESKDGRLKTTV